MRWLGCPFRVRAVVVLVYVALVVLASGLIANALPRPEPTVEELKARLSSTSIRDRPHLCLEIAKQQLAATDKLYAAAEDAQAQVPLTDVVAYSELARDYAIQSHKHEKQTEIAVRMMARRLTEIMNGLAMSDQAPLRDALSHLQRVRDDLLAAMFPKGAK